MPSNQYLKHQPNHKQQTNRKNMIDPITKLKAAFEILHHATATLIEAGEVNHYSLELVNTMCQIIINALPYDYETGEQFIARVQRDFELLANPAMIDENTKVH